jgi:DNA-binding transcriptional regulator PaaX
MRIALALLGAAQGEPLTIPMLIGAAEVLRLSPNAMRVAISRLTARGEVTARRRGAYALSSGRRLEAFAHVRRYRTGFATRVPWRGDFLGALTADLPRRNATLLRRRTQALDLAGFRALHHGLYARPNNLAGGRDAVAAHLARLGLDPAAEVIGLTLDARQRNQLERGYRISADQLRARSLTREVKALLPQMRRRPPREVAAKSFWLGDEVLRFLARDPLLPPQLADPAPREKLADAMSTLDEEGLRVWRALLEDLDR